MAKIERKITKNVKNRHLSVDFQCKNSKCVKNRHLSVDFKVKLMKALSGGVVRASSRSWSFLSSKNAVLKNTDKLQILTQIAILAYF